MSTYSKIPGYHRRPFWTYVAALAFVLAPLASLYGELYTVGLGNPSHFSVWGAALSSVGLASWAVLIAVFVSGVSLFFVRSLSLHFTMLALGLVLAHNVVLWSRAPEAGAYRLALMTLVTILVLGAFWRTDLRKPYLEPRVRWWETAARFKVDLPVEVEGRAAKLLDVSRTGALIEGRLAAAVGSDVILRFPKQHFEVHARIVRNTLENATGLEFTKVPWVVRSALRSYLRALERDPARVARS